MTSALRGGPGLREVGLRVSTFPKGSKSPIGTVVAQSPPHYQKSGESQRRQDSQPNQDELSGGVPAPVRITAMRCP